MNLKSIGLSAAIATTAIAGSSFATSPAQAASLTGVLNFFGGVSFDKVSNPTKLTFLDADPKAPGINFKVDGSTTTLAFNTPQLNQVTGDGKIVPSVINLTGGVGGPYTSWLTGLNVGGKVLSFDLTSFTLGTPTIASLGGGFSKYVYDSSLVGKFFIDSKEFVGLGAFSTQFVLNAEDANKPNGTSYSGTLVAVPVPTPALLPALLGLGVAALRKRKSEESGVEAAETAKA